MTSSNGNILLALCAGNSPLTGESPHNHKGQWRGALLFSLIFVFVDPNKRLSKKIETPMILDAIALIITSLQYLTRSQVVTKSTLLCRNYGQSLRSRHVGQASHASCWRPLWQQEKRPLMLRMRWIKSPGKFPKRWSKWLNALLHDLHYISNQDTTALCVQFFWKRYSFKVLSWLCLWLDRYLWHAISTTCNENSKCTVLKMYIITVTS